MNFWTTQYILWIFFLLLLLSCPVVSDSLHPHELQHIRPLCPSPSPEVCPSSCPLHWWCHPAISSSDTYFYFCLQFFPASGTFSNESAVHIRWPKYWNFSFSISPSSEYSGMISLKIDWFNLIAVQGTFRNLLQHHSLKASILLLSAFFMVQFSHPYLITRKTLALNLWTFVSKAMSLFLTHCLGLS